MTRRQFLHSTAAAATTSALTTARATAESPEVKTKVLDVKTISFPEQPYAGWRAPSEKPRTQRWCGMWA